MPGIGNLSKGSFSGRETYVYYDSIVGSYSEPATEEPTWVEISRVRNVQFEDGPELTDVNFHGSDTNGAIPGYKSNSGSWEYVRRRGTDPVYTYLKNAQANAEPIYLQFLDNKIDVDGAAGHTAPYYLGKFSESRNGNDEVVVTMPFSFADVFDENGDQVAKEDVTISV